jgi:hypothetical protein
MRALLSTDYRSPYPVPGAIEYHSRAPDFSTMLSDAKTLNREALGRLFLPESTAIVRGLDALHSLAGAHAWTHTFCANAGPHPADHVLFACFHKTLLSLHAAHELTLDGLYGVARPHLRQSFESSMIAKLCAVDPDSEVFDKWIDGLDVYFTNGVLRRIACPSTDQFSQSWDLLCRWSHATVYASQLSLDLKTTESGSRINFALIGVLLHFQSHLLTRHMLTPTAKYYALRYGNRERIIYSRQSLKAVLSTLYGSLGPASRRLVKDFKTKWRLK